MISVHRHKSIAKQESKTHKLARESFLKRSVSSFVLHGCIKRMLIDWLPNCTCPYLSACPIVHQILF